MLIKEILEQDNEIIKIFSAKPMTCPSCDGTGKDRFSSNQVCQDCGGKGKFPQPGSDINHETMMKISDTDADSFYKMLKLDNIETMRDGGYITPKNFLQLNNILIEALKNIKDDDDQIVRQPIKYVDKSGDITRIVSKPAVVNKGKTAEEKQVLLKDFQKILNFVFGKQDYYIFFKSEIGSN